VIHCYYDILAIYILGRMPCAKAENKMTATGLFTDICPSGYIIDEVYPLSSKKKPYCRWSVKFIKDNEEELPPPGRELKQIFNMLTRYTGSPRTGGPK
jgi:hypothetical protein